MDYAFPELLGREEIIHILSQRHLEAEYLETLPTPDLKQIYISFAMPRAKRESTQRRALNSNQCYSQTVVELVPEENATLCTQNARKRQQMAAALEDDDDDGDDDVEMEDTDFPIKRLKYNDENLEAMNCEKRERDCKEDYVLSEDYNYLNVVTKRIKIN